MKKIILACCVVSATTLISGCAVDSVDTTGTAPGYYKTYTIGYAGYGGDGTYGSYTPSYWNSSYYYYPGYNNYWSNAYYGSRGGYGLYGGRRGYAGYGGHGGYGGRGGYGGGRGGHGGHGR